MDFLNREWRVHTRFRGVACSDDGQEFEECAEPVIPDCVDRNPYCELPPWEPYQGNLTHVTRPVPGDEWMTVPGTVLRYTCPTDKWYFGYSLPDPFVSYHHSTNIDDIQIECHRSK